MNLFAKLREWHAGRVEALAAVGVTYTRGADSIDIDATVGNTRFARTAEGQAAVVIGERDYLIRVELLAGFGEPKRGEKIAELIDGEVVTFSVQEPETGEPAWRYSDPQRTRYRVHVKRV